MDVNLNKRPFFLKQREIDWVNDKLLKMTLEEKIGQLFVVLGDSFKNDELMDLVSKGVGGVLFRPDTQINIFKRYSTLDKLSALPLIKAANLEDGPDGAFSDCGKFSSEMGIGATKDYSFAYKMGVLTSFYSNKAGINMNFAPDLDIDYNFLNPITSERTYGSDPKLTKEMISQEIKGFKENNIYCCLKHFPGDGVDFRDQHLHPTYNTFSYSKWMKTFGNVYKKGIRSGAVGVMCGHIVAPYVEIALNPSLKYKDTSIPCLSKTLLQNLLRRALHFNGLILSDATIMGGFTESGLRKQTIPLMIENGVDLIVFNTDYYEDKEYIKEGISDGLLSLDRLNDAVKRILAFKAMVLFKKKTSLHPSSKWVEECADKSISLIKDKDNIIPINKSKYLKIKLISIGEDACEDGSIINIAREYLEAKGYQVSVFDIENENIRGTNKLNSQEINIYLANCPTKSNQTTVRIKWKEKHALDKPAFVNEQKYIFISFANPFHLIDVPRVNVYINAYTASRFFIIKALEKILGFSQFKGVCPVDPFCSLEDTKL